MVDRDETSNRIGQDPAPVWRRPSSVAVVMLLLIATFYVLREHWNHVAGLWPYLILLACPLMHLFHGHGGHNTPLPGSNDRSSTEQR